MVKKARELEMQYMEELKVLEEAIGMRAWLKRVDHGSRLTGSTSTRAIRSDPTTEAGWSVKRHAIDVEDWAATFAATPPYEAFKLQLSLMMTGPRSQVEGDDDVLMLLDIARAHLHSPLARAVFVTIDGKVYKLLQAMYGLSGKVLDVMNLMGVPLGKFSICVGYPKAINTHLTRRDECLFEANTACLVQLVMLVRWRHVEILVSQMGLSNGTTDEEDVKERGAEDRACYRCELQFAVKELARRMQQPNTRNMQALKRLVRFLMGSARCLVVYNRQAEQPIVGVRRTTVDFVFVRAAWWASPCRVDNNRESGSNKLRRSVVLRVDQESIEISGRSGHGC